MSDLEGMEEILEEFLVESYENLDQLDRDLVELEENSSSGEILGRIFRTIHTIKGTSGFLAFSKLEKVAHVGENLLALLRDGKLELNPEITTALLRMVDAVRQMLASIEATHAEGDGDYTGLIETLTALKEGRAPSAAAAPKKAAEPAPVAEKPAPAEAAAPPAPVAAAPKAAPKPAPQAKRAKSSADEGDDGDADEADEVAKPSAGAARGGGGGGGGGGGA